MRNSLLFQLIGILLLTGLIVIVDASEDIDIKTLVQFKLSGTSIDIMPEHIHVIVSDPDAQIESYLKNRRIFKTDIPSTVKMYGALVTFDKPSEYPKAVDVEHPYHEIGDVIYTFLLESEKEKISFIKKYKLRLYATRVAKGGFEYKEYVSEPGYYINLLTYYEKLGGYTSRQHLEYVKGLQCKLVVQKSRYIVGETVFAYLYLKNHSEKNIVICLQPSRNEMVFTYYGDCKPITKKQKTFYEKPGSKDSFIEIKPGMEIRYLTLEFGHEYLDKVGQWELSIEYIFDHTGEEFGLRAWKGKLVTNEVSIIIEDVDSNNKKKQKL